MAIFQCEESRRCQPLKSVLQPPGSPFTPLALPNPVPFHELGNSFGLPQAAHRQPPASYPRMCTKLPPCILSCPLSSLPFSVFGLLWPRPLGRRPFAPPSGPVYRPPSELEVPTFSSDFFAPDLLLLFFYGRFFGEEHLTVSFFFSRLGPVLWSLSRSRGWRTLHLICPLAVPGDDFFGGFLTPFRNCFPVP